ncbi:MAG: ribbon-helix-helix protein, CopG family [Prochloraceae cyanobacterium]|nr:ribbon-helix-helix protein, CopG family [Prochloraceae cyanobacterium]
MPKKITNKKGAPKGHVGNPSGKNQWDGIRSDKPIGIRLLKDLDAELREYTKEEGITLTQFIEQAIAEKLKRIKTSA